MAAVARVGGDEGNTLTVRSGSSENADLVVDFLGNLRKRLIVLRSNSELTKLSTSPSSSPNCTKTIPSVQITTFFFLRIQMLSYHENRGCSESSKSKRIPDIGAGGRSKSKSRTHSFGGLSSETNYFTDC